MRFYKIQTNRAKLKKILSSFKMLLSDGETVKAPRPLPGRSTQFYIVFFQLVEESPAHKYLIKNLSKASELSTEAFMEEINSYKHFWE